MNTNFKEIWPTALLLAVLAFVFFTKTQGPFIVDEFVYANIARDILHLKFTGVSQYAPLYPALTSFAYLDWWPQHRFDIIQYLNMLFFFAGALGAFLLARLYLNKAESILFSMLVLLHPWGAVKLMNWAEPLFYCLFIWFWWAVLSHKKQPSPLRFLLVVVFAIALFLTKQSGILPILAAAMTIFILTRIKGTIITKPLYPYISVGLIIVLLIVMNKFLSGSALGYQERVESFIGLSFLDKKFWLAAANNFSYLLFASLVFFPAVVVAALLNYRKVPSEQKTLIVATGLYTVLIILVTAMHRATYPGIETIPFGRYIAPLQILLIFTGLVVAKEAKIPWLMGIGIIMIGMLAIINPLHAMTAYGALNNFDLAIWQNLLNYQMEWKNLRSVQDGDVLRSIVGLFVIFMIFAAFRWKYPRGIAVFALVFFSYSGLRAQNNLFNVADSLKDLNVAASWLSKKAEDETIYVDAQLFDSKQVKDVLSFWFDRKERLIPISANRVMETISFDFGRPDSNLPIGSVRVSAPFHASGNYAPTKGFGFDSIFSIDAGNLIGQKDGGILDFVVGWEDRIFRIDVPPGRYHLKIRGMATVPIAEKSQFRIFGPNGKKLIDVQGATYYFSDYLFLESSGLEIKFSASLDAVWYVSDLVLTVEDFSIPPKNGYFLTTSGSLMTSTTPSFRSGKMAVYAFNSFRK